MRSLNCNLQALLAVDNGLWTIGSLFNAEDFDYIKQSILAVPCNQYIDHPAHKDLRFELVWVNDGILEELTEAFDRTTNQISELIEIPVMCNQVRVWRDQPGFMIPFHEDDQNSVAHIQVYIDSATDDIGTTWYTTQGRHTCAFTPNTGYLTVCKYRYPHGMLKPTTNQTRYSLYATFAKRG